MSLHQNLLILSVLERDLFRFQLTDGSISWAIYYPEASVTFHCYLDPVIQNAFMLVSS